MPYSHLTPEEQYALLNTPVQPANTPAGGNAPTGGNAQQSNGGFVNKVINLPWYAYSPLGLMGAAADQGMGDLQEHAGIDVRGWGVTIGVAFLGVVFIILALFFGYKEGAR